MIGTLAYLGALMAPEIADAAGKAAGSFAQQTGRRLAAGMADELSERLANGGSGILNTLNAVLQREAGSTMERSQQAVVNALEKVLSTTGAALVSEEELGLLREVAVAAATGGDVAHALDVLRAFHLRQASSAASTPQT